MSTVQLTRAQRRQMLRDEADLRRQHRVRIAGAAEIEREPAQIASVSPLRLSREPNDGNFGSANQRQPLKNTGAATI